MSSDKNVSIVSPLDFSGLSSNGGKKSPDAPLLLEIKDLTKHFRVRRRLFADDIVVHACDQVSLYVRDGETLGLVGESGSGKTTIGRCALLLIRPTSGEIYFEGKNLLSLKSNELRNLRRRMQMVFQDPADSLNPRFTCRQTLLDALKHAGVKDRRERARQALHLLEQVGLELADLDKYPHQFSGGQQQRIAIARALAFNPKLLILDEPTASLDVSVKAQITQLLNDLQKKLNHSYILISHDLSNVKHVSNRVAVMYLGQIVEVGNTCDVFENPMHPYTKVLIESVPIPDPFLVRKPNTLKGEIPSPVAPPSGCRFHTRCPIRKDICDHVEPHLVRVGPDRMIACNL